MQSVVFRSVASVGRQYVARRAMSAAPVITDSSWAAEQLTKMGVQLAPTPMTGAEEVNENFLDTPSEKVTKIVDEVLALNVIEMCQLQRKIQQRLGVNRQLVEQAFMHSMSAQNMVFNGHVPVGGAGAPMGDIAAGGAAAAPAAEEKKEKDAFDLKLKVVDAKVKIKVIKEIRTITGLGLKEAKDLVEKAPVLVKPGLKKEEAEAFKKLLVDAGAEVELA